MGAEWRQQQEIEEQRVWSALESVKAGKATEQDLKLIECACGFTNAPRVNEEIKNCAF